MVAGLEWPQTRWKLSAPESYVLINGTGASGVEAFKLAIEELIARSHLGIVKVPQRGFLGRTSEVAVVVPGTKSSDTSGLSAPLRDVMDLYNVHVTRHLFGETYGAAVADLAKAGVKKHKSLSRFTKQVVLPEMLERGFYVEQKSRVLGVIPRTQYVLTETGTQARAELEEWLATGKARFAEWVTNDPSKALGYFGMAGASILLMSALFPDVRRLQDRLADDGTSAFLATSGATSDEDRTESKESVGEIGQMDFDLGVMTFDFDLSAFDSIDSAIDSIDSGVDSGASDGGGGDGGGGGC